MHSDEVNNQTLTILKRRQSRRRILEGDVFSLACSNGTYVIGRVIDVAADSGFGPHDVLIYLHSPFVENESELERVGTLDLLVPPMIVGSGLWNAGFAKFIEHRQLSTDQVLPVHCFFNILAFKSLEMYERSIFKSFYYDEHNNPLAHRFEPCGPAGFVWLNGLEGFLNEAASGRTLYFGPPR